MPPSRKTPARKGPWQIGPLAAEQARVCIMAADRRARGATWAEIAEEFSLASPAEAKKTVERGYSLAPGEDYHSGRRKCFDELNLIRREFHRIYENPGPATTVSGKIILDEDGNQIPDRQVQVAALNGIRAVNTEERRLGGYDAPRQTVTVSAHAPLEDLQAMVARAREELAQAEALAGQDPGYPALPPGSA
jgi:hypothetical protein